MVRINECDCSNRIETSINSMALFQQLKGYFKKEVEKGTFIELVPTQPYFVWKDKGKETKRYASKWYKCVRCGCLWEFEYPDFPSQGFIRKFPDGIYKVKEISSSSYIPFQNL